MTPLVRTRLLCVFGAIAFAGQEVAAAQRCSEFRLPLVLQIATGTTARPSAVHLVADRSPALRLVEASTSKTLWTAGAAGAYTQRFAGMTAGFWSSLAALDSDGDGIHDRIYAGDLQGRLWRFDVDARRPPSSWMTGGIFADLSAVRGRGFLAAPDLALITPAGMKPWLSIALGTAYTASGPAHPETVRGLNRFYVLRDRAPHAHWTQDQYDRWTPLLETDLALAEGTQLDATRAGGDGFYINLGTRQVVAPALTLDGNTVYTVAATSESLLPACNASRKSPAVTISTGSISAVDGSLNTMTLGMEPVSSAPAGSAVTLLPDGGSSSGKLVCAVAGHTLPGCSIDSILRRSFWRREDAD